MTITSCRIVPVASVNPDVAIVAVGEQIMATLVQSVAGSKYDETISQKNYSCGYAHYTQRLTNQTSRVQLD